MKKQNIKEITETAHIITKAICKIKGYSIKKKIDRFKEEKYVNIKSQHIFDKYYNLMIKAS